MDDWEELIKSFYYVFLMYYQGLVLKNFLKSSPLMHFTCRMKSIKDFFVMQKNLIYRSSHKTLNAISIE